MGINPWIYDFAAYNLWSRPVGLLTCLDMFSRSGCATALLDLMDHDLSHEEWPAPRPEGEGHYPKTALPKPFVLKDVPRIYSRYGLSMQCAEDALSALSPGPHLVLVTSLMTYWYPGVAAAINMVRKIFPMSRICLGGIYATLCFEHARGLGADLVISGPLERPDNWTRVWGLMGKTAPELPEHAGMTPDTSYYREPDYSIIMCSRGCPFNCPYCASSTLYPAFCRADPDWIRKHIRDEYERGIKNFCFYDDALLVEPECVLYPILEFIIANSYNLTLHAPNALHIRYLSPRTCSLLKKAGLKTVRLGLETTSFKKRRDTKLCFADLNEGITNLLNAGFVRKDVVVYILAGLPGQTEEEIRTTILECRKMGFKPEVNFYSPIPGTPLFEKARKISRYPLDEPLCQNNSIWPCVKEGFSWDKQKRIKSMIRS